MPSALLKVDIVAVVIVMIVMIVRSGGGRRVFATTKQEIAKNEPTLALKQLTT